MKIKSELDKAIELDSTNIAALVTKFRMFVNSFGKEPISKENLLSQASLIKKLDPIEGHLAFAKYYLVTDANKSAQMEYEKALSFYPESKRVMASFALYLLKIDEYDKCVELFSKLVEEESDNLKLNFKLGIILILSGRDFEKAKYYLKKSLSLESDDGLPTREMVHWCLGAAYYFRNKPDMSQKEWELLRD